MLGCGGEGMFAAVLCNARAFAAAAAAVLKLGARSWRGQHWAAVFAVVGHAGRSGLADVKIVDLRSENREGCGQWTLPSPGT